MIANRKDTYAITTFLFQNVEHNTEYPHWDIITSGAVINAKLTLCRSRIILKSPSYNIIIKK